jgi:phage terminase small subunit
MLDNSLPDELSLGPVLSTPDEDSPEARLNPRQAAFVREYLVDLNGTQAAIRAGYSAACASVQASKLVADPKIADAIERGKAQRLASVNIAAADVLSEMDALARSNICHYVISDEGQVELAPGAPDNAMAAIKSIKKKTRVDKDGSRTYDVEVQLWDKPGSLKLMGKHAGVKAFFDKVEVSGPDGGPIPITEVRSIIVDPKS